MAPPRGSAPGVQFQERSGGSGAERLTEEEGLGGASGFGGFRGGDPTGKAKRVDLSSARSHLDSVRMGIRGGGCV